MSKKKLMHPKTGTKVPEIPDDEDRVRLRPFFGIRPGVYLAYIYGFAILAVLFFLLVGPGIWRPGSVLSFSSEPFGAACRIDGVYWDAAPSQVFVPAGKHNIEMVLPGFNSWTAEIEVPNRLFASLFFPLKYAVHGELKPDDPVSAFRDAAAEFASWTFAGEPTASSQIPLSLSEAAYRIGPEIQDPLVREDIEEILTSSLRFGVTRAALRDLLRAKFLADSQGISPSPLGLLSSAGDIINLLENSPGTSVWLADMLQGEAALIKDSSWHKAEISTAEAAILGANSAVSARPSNSLLLEGIRFWEIPSGSSVQGAFFPRKVSFESFFIAGTEVGRALWDNFLAEEPGWRDINIETLIQNSLVTGDYLRDYALPGAPSPDDRDSPVNSLSWYAASAFCEWFNSRLPPAYSEWEIRLPYEAEWEYAASFLPEMSRIHWEWCANGYAPIEIFSVNGTSGPMPDGSPGSPERSVRGGSWINPVNSVNISTRASLPPETCSVFVSFRPVLARKMD